MSKVRVKMCGITSAEDAVTCLELGVDYLGLIFAFGTHRVTVEQAEAIREVVPEVSVVGVFRDATRQTIAEVSRACRLNMIQLHGGEDPGECEAIARETGLPILKARTPGIGEEYKDEDYTSRCSLLFDLEKEAPATDEERTVLWERAAKAVQRGDQVFLAGGLTPDNVVDAIRFVRPACVDVIRGIERAPGVKDAVLMQRFVKEVRLA